MSRKTDRKGQLRPRCYLHLDLRDVAALRRDGGDQKAFERILASCDRWISECFSRVPSHADREEMVDAAFLAVIQDLLSDQVSPKTFRCRLEWQLELQRNQWEQHVEQIMNLTKDFGQPLCTAVLPDDRLHLEFWMDVVREIEHCMFPAILSLSEKDRDLLAQAYGLAEMNDPSHASQTRTFPSENSRRAALSRARTRFSKHLESLLVTALEVQERERCILEAALRIVRGKAISKALDAVKGLKRER
jgi:hypothetical protein